MHMIAAVIALPILLLAALWFTAWAEREITSDAECERVTASPDRRSA